MAVVAFVERLNKNKTPISQGGRDIGVPYAGPASDVDGSALEVKAVGYPADKIITFPCPSGARDNPPFGTYSSCGIQRERRRANGLHLKSRSFCQFRLARSRAGTRLG
jgi:hypothetical protein